MELQLLDCCSHKVVLYGYSLIAWVLHSSNAWGVLLAWGIHPFMGYPITHEGSNNSWGWQPIMRLLSRHEVAFTS